MIGYEQEGFHWKHAEIECLIHKQSVDIAQGVDAAGNKDEGAGDQGILFGYACRETEALMPAPLYYAHLVLRRISELRRQGDRAVAGLLPDAKSQVTLRYDDGRPVEATSVSRVFRSASVFVPEVCQVNSVAVVAMMRPIQLNLRVS